MCFVSFYMACRTEGAAEGRTDHNNGWNVANIASNTWKPCVSCIWSHSTDSVPVITTSSFSPIKVPPASCGYRWKKVSWRQWSIQEGAMWQHVEIVLVSRKPDKLMFRFLYCTSRGHHLHEKSVRLCSDMRASMESVAFPTTPSFTITLPLVNIEQFKSYPTYVSVNALTLGRCALESEVGCV